MQKVNKSSVKKGAALCLAMAMACTAFVGCGKKDDAASASGATSESAVEVLDNSKLTEMPDGVSLSEDQMKTTMNAYIALVWQYVVSSFGEKQQKNAILEKSTTIYNQRKLRKRELENKKYEEQLKQKASEVKKEVAEASTNAKLEKVKKELYDFKATSMKRETALRKKNDDAESRIHELEKLLANAERKLIQLRPETSEFDDFDDSDAGICEQETEVIDYHKELNQMAKNKKIVFCGGQQNFVNMLRNAQPDISYVDQCNLATCDALIANSDIVIFRVTQMSHSLYGKAKQICKARGIRFEHLPNVTSIPLTEELIYTLITKKEATGNE